MKPLFVPAQQNKVFGYPIQAIVGCARKLGDIGIEVECEGNKFEKNNTALSPLWGYHPDHSLRGADNAEYVLCEPIKFDEVPEAISTLWSVMDKYGTVLDESNRTSVHIHLNVQAFNLNRLAAFAGIWFALEELLAEWAGDHRVGNLFCLRAKDAPAIASRLKKYIQQEGSTEIFDGIHYSGLNFQAIQKFGSVEVRYLRGPTEPKLILDWIAILRRIYEVSAQFPDPRDVCSAFSYAGPTGFLQEMLGPETGILLAGLEMNDEQIRDSLYEGIRIAQDICYCRDWALYEPIPLQIDPFGRPMSKPSSKKNPYADNVVGVGPGQLSSYDEYSVSTVPSSSLPTFSVDTFSIWNTIPSSPDPVDEPDETEDDDYEPEYDPDEGYDPNDDT